MAYARKVDENHQLIVRTLRQLGCRVLDLSRVGEGCPDVLVLDRQRRLHLVEIKAVKGKLTDDQVDFHDDWPVWILRTPDDAIRLFNV